MHNNNIYYRLVYGLSDYKQHNILCSQLLYYYAIIINYLLLLEDIHNPAKPCTCTTAQSCTTFFPHSAIRGKEKNYVEKEGGEKSRGILGREVF